MAKVLNYKGVLYVAANRKAPKSFRRPATCGNCGRTWDDGIPTGLTPTPAGRCPFEYMHGHNKEEPSKP